MRQGGSLMQQEGDSLPAADPKDAATWLSAPSHLLVPSAPPDLPPPVETRPQLLPVDQLSWENFERLCLPPPGTRRGVGSCVSSRRGGACNRAGRATVWVAEAKLNLASTCTREIRLFLARRLQTGALSPSRHVGSRSVLQGRSRAASTTSSEGQVGASLSEVHLRHECVCRVDQDDRRDRSAGLATHRRVDRVRGVGQRGDLDTAQSLSRTRRRLLRPGMGEMFLR